MYTLGIDIGGTFIKYALVDNNKKIVEQWKVETELHDNPKSFYDTLVLNARDVSQVNLIAVSAPGVIDSHSKVTSIASENVAIMYTTNINENISSRTQIPCYSMNDAKAAAYCELKMGSTKNTQSSIVFIIGTGIGGAITLGEKVLEGIDGYAGEFSRIPIIDSNGNMNIASSMASATALIDIYNSKSASSVRKAKEVFELYHEKDVTATEAMGQWIRNIVFLLGGLVAIYNPEVIAIGGAVTKDCYLLDNIKKGFNPFYRERLFAQPKLSTRIVACEHLADSNILGAVLFAREQV